MHAYVARPPADRQKTFGLNNTIRISRIFPLPTRENCGFPLSRLLALRLRGGVKDQDKVDVGKGKGRKKQRWINKIEKPLPVDCCAPEREREERLPQKKTEPEITMRKESASPPEVPPSMNVRFFFSLLTYAQMRQCRSSFFRVPRRLRWNLRGRRLHLRSLPGRPRLRRRRRRRRRRLRPLQSRHPPPPPPPPPQ